MGICKKKKKFVKLGRFIRNMANYVGRIGGAAVLMRPYQASLVSTLCCPLKNNVHRHVRFLTSRGVKSLFPYTSTCFKPPRRTIAMASSAYEMKLRQELDKENITTLQILDDVDVETLNRFESSDVMNLVSRMTMCHMNDLKKSYTWLYESYRPIHYAQLTLANKVNDSSESIRNHPNFPYVLEAVERVHTDLGSLELCQMLRFLLYVIEPDSAISHKLLSEMGRRVPSMNVKSLNQAVHCYDMINSSGIWVPPAAVQRLVTLLKEKEKWSPEELGCIADTSAMLYRVLTIDSILDCVITIFDRNILDPDSVDDLGYIGDIIYLYAYTVFKMLFGQYDMDTEYMERRSAFVRDTTTNQILSNCVEACLIHSDKLTTHIFSHLCDICTVKPIIDVIPGIGVAHNKLGDIASQFLQEECTLAELIQLTRAFAPSFKLSTEVTEQISRHLNRKLGDMDIVLTCHLARNVLWLGDEELLRNFQSILINEKMDLMKDYWRQSLNIFRFVVLQPVRNPALQSTMLDKLTQFVYFMKERWGHSAYYGSLCLLCLANSPGLPPPLLASLIQYISKWSSDIPHFYQYLNIHTKPVVCSGHCLRQIETVKDLLQKQIITRLQETNNYHDFFRIAMKAILVYRPELHGRRRSKYDRYSSFVLKIASMVPNFIHPGITDEEEFHKLQIFFIVMAYHSPEALEKLITIALKQRDKFSLNTYQSLLYLLRHVGYQPNNPSNLVELVDHIITECKRKGDYRAITMVLNSLAHLQFFPLKELKDLFTLDTMEKLDKYKVNGSNGERSNILNDIQQLTKAAALECPELNIPWYYNDHTFSESSSYTMRLMRDEVASCLEHVLGGTNFYSRWVHLPYNYYIDFECVLNQKEDPVDFKRAASSQSAGPLQRVAVLAAGRSTFCPPDYKKAKGFHKVKKRHLEIMGYKVVEVPFYEWTSLEMSSRGARQQYLHNKIFSSKHPS